jgi:hypothetical protein
MGYELADPVEIDLASPRERDRAIADTPEY